MLLYPTQKIKKAFAFNFFLIKSDVRFTAFSVASLWRGKVWTKLLNFMNAGILDQSDTGSLRNSMPTPNALKKYGD